MSVQKTASHNPGNSLEEKERLRTLETLRSLDGLVQKKEDNCENPTNGTLDEHWRLLLKTLARETVVQPIQSQNMIMVNQPPSTPVQQQACLPDSSPESAASKCPTYTTADCKTRKKRKTRYDNWFSKRHHADDKTSTQAELKGRRKQSQKPSRFLGEVQGSQSLKVNSKHRKQHLQQLRDSRPMFMPGDQKKSAVSSGTIKKMGRIPGQYSLSFTDDVSVSHYKSSSQIPRQPGQTLKLKRLESTTKVSREILNPKKTQSMSGYKTHKEDNPKDQIHQDGAYQTKKEPLVQRESMVKGRDDVLTSSTKTSAISPIPFPKAPASHRSNSDNNRGASKDIDLGHLMPNQRLLTVLTSTRTTESKRGRQHDKGHSSRKLSTRVHKKVLVVPLHRRSLPHHIPTRTSGPSHKPSQTSAESSSYRIARESETESQSIKTRAQTAGHGKPDPCRILVSQNTLRLIKENGLQHQLISHRAEETCSPHEHLTRQVVAQRLPSKIPHRMIKENCLLHQQKSQLEEETHSPHHHLHQLPNQHLKVMGNDGLACRMPCGQKKSCNHPVQSEKQSELHLLPNAREKFISNASSNTKMPKKKDNNISNNDNDRVGRFRKCKDKLSLIFHHHHHHHHHHHGNLFRRFLHLDKEDEGGFFFAEDKKPLHRKEHGQLHMLLAAFLRYILHPRKARAEHKRLAKAKMMTTGHRVKKIHWWQKFYKRGGVGLANRKKTHLRISMGANSGRSKVAARH